MKRTGYLRPKVPWIATMAVMVLGTRVGWSQAPRLSIVYVQGDDVRTAAAERAGDLLRAGLVSVSADDARRSVVLDEFRVWEDDVKQYPAQIRLKGELCWTLGPQRNSSVGFALTPVPRFELRRIPLPLAEAKADVEQVYRSILAEGATWPPLPASDSTVRRALSSGMGPYLVDTWGGNLQAIYESAIHDVIVYPNGLAGFSERTIGPVTPARQREMPASCAYDIVPIDARSIYLVVATRPIEYRRYLLTKTDAPAVGVLRFRLAPPIRDSGGSIEWKGSWEPAEEFRSDFAGPFRAFFVGDERWFVTELGSLYRADRSRTPAEVREVRLREGQLIQAVLLDEDRGQAPLAFTSKYWFKLEQPIEYHEFDFSLPAGDDPVPTLVRAAREVRKVYPAVEKKAAEGEATK